MIVPVGGDVVAYLCGFHLHSLAPHERYHPLIRCDWIRADDYTAGLILFSSLAIPLALFYQRNRISRLWIDVQDVPQHFLRARCQHFWLFVLARHYFLVEFIRILILEWEVAAEHCVQNNSTGPNINASAFVSLSGNHFRGSIAGWAAGRLQPFSWLVLVGKAEVYNFYVFMLVEE